MPKKGNVFLPPRKGSYAREIAGALKRELGGTHQTVKIVMKWTGAGERTVKNWLSGEIGPSGPHLIALIRHSDAVMEAMLHSAGRTQIVASNTVVKVRDAMTESLERINYLLEKAAE